MAEPSRGMGRGLAALLSNADPEAEPELRALPVELIAPNPRQPRREFDEDRLVALSRSLRERGVLQPVLVRPVPGGTYELIAGERRWRAAQLAGLETVPALVRAARRRDVARARADREHGPRGPQSGRGGACGRGAGRRARRDQARTSGAGSGARASRCRTSCACSTCRTRRSTCSSAASCRRVTAARSSRRPITRTRRRLAREAAAHGWSVRETEAAARGADSRGEIRARRLARRPPGSGRRRRAARGGVRPRARSGRPGHAAGGRLPDLTRVRVAGRGARGGLPARGRDDRLSAVAIAIIGRPRAD